MDVVIKFNTNKEVLKPLATDRKPTVPSKLSLVVGRQIKPPPTASVSGAQTAMPRVRRI